MCLWFMLERKTRVKKLSDIKSLTFLIKVFDWQRECRDAGYEPIIRIGYQLIGESERRFSQKREIALQH